jgi:hypothetical protein
MPDSDPQSGSTSQPLSKRQSREPQALSNEYHRARKQLMMWSAILFIWELVGVDLDRMKEAGGNFGALVGALKSPQAVPWALVILVAYFLFKVTIEWFQCAASRRALRVSQIDFVSAWLVALVAYALYIAQLSGSQIANQLQSSREKGHSVLLGLVLGIVIAVGVAKLIRRDVETGLGAIGSAAFAGIAILIVERLRGNSFVFTSILIGFLVSMVTAAVLTLATRFLRWTVRGNPTR